MGEKYYAADQGFTQAITGQNKANIGRVIENIVLIELLIRGWNVTIGKVGGLGNRFRMQKTG